MDTWLTGVGAITLFAEDLDLATSFYRDVLELPLMFQDENSAAFQLGKTIINVLAIPAARELIEPGPVAGRDAGSRFQLSIWVENADAVCADLARRGVTLLNGPADRAWGMRTAAFADPGGHVWEIAQELPATEGS